MTLALRILYLSLLAWITAGSVLLKPAAADVGALPVIVMAKLLPLTVFLRAIWKESGYGLLALSLVLLFYMGFAVMDCFVGGLHAVMGGGALTLEILLSVLALKIVKQQPRGQGAA